MSPNPTFAKLTSPQSSFVGPLHSTITIYLPSDYSLPGQPLGIYPYHKNLVKFLAILLSNKFSKHYFEVFDVFILSFNLNYSLIR